MVPISGFNLFPQFDLGRNVSFLATASRRDEWLPSVHDTTRRQTPPPRITAPRHETVSPHSTATAVQVAGPRLHLHRARRALRQHLRLGRARLHLRRPFLLLRGRRAGRGAGLTNDLGPPPFVRAPRGFTPTAVVGALESKEERQPRAVPPAATTVATTRGGRAGPRGRGHR